MPYITLRTIGGGGGGGNIPINLNFATNEPYVLGITRFLDTSFKPCRPAQMRAIWKTEIMELAVSTKHDVVMCWVYKISCRRIGGLLLKTAALSNQQLSMFSSGYFSDE